MKKKLLLICISVLTVILSCVASYLGNDKKERRFHQHLESPAYKSCTCSGNELCTHLPIVVINTHGVEIPGETISETDNDKSMLLSSIKIIDNENSNNHPGDKPVINQSSLISIRGNSSRSFDKKNYLLRFVNDKNEYDNISVMGMDKHYEWALHGPYLDKSFIRNYMWYNIAGEIMDYAPNVRFCEVILNDKYIGLYVFTETITSGENSRLKLKEPIYGTESTGYILRLDLGANTELKNIKTFSNYAYRNYQKFDIRYPRSGQLTSELVKAIESEYSEFEKALYSYDYDTKNYGYWNYIDVDSFVDYFIINEFTANYDAGWLSTYIYKDIGEKYKLVIWDFNSACDNYEYTQIRPHKLDTRNSLWYYMLVKDEKFTKRVISRYKELRKSYLSEEYLNNYIDSVVTYLGDAIKRNNEVWGYTYEIAMINPPERNPRNHNEAIMSLKDFIKERGNWLDKNIEIIKQFSHESKVKKFNH